MKKGYKPIKLSVCFVSSLALLYQFAKKQSAVGKEIFREGKVVP